MILIHNLLHISLCFSLNGLTHFKLLIIFLIMHGRGVWQAPTNESFTLRHCIFVPHNEGIYGHMGIWVRVWRIQPIININIYMYLETRVFQDKPPPSMAARPSMPGTDSQLKHTCKQSIFSNAGYLTRVLQDHASLASLSSDTPLPKGSSSMLFWIWPQLI